MHESAAAIAQFANRAYLWVSAVVTPRKAETDPRQARFPFQKQEMIRAMVLVRKNTSVCRMHST